MTFYILLKHDSRKYFLKVERTLCYEDSEQFLVSGRNKSILLQTNRLFIRSKGLKHKRPSWHLVEGSITNQSGLEKIIKLVADALE